MALPGRPPSTDECESRSRDGRGRMLRVEYKGQPYDWFNLDDMGDLIHSEDFASTLKENINHYFEVGFDDQAVFDEDGLLVSPADYLRSLRHPRPYFRVFSLRQMPPDLKEQTVEKLTTLQLEVDKMQQVLRGSSSLTTRPVWSGSVPTSAGQIAGPAASPSPPPAPVEGFAPASYSPVAVAPASYSSPSSQSVKASCLKCGQAYERETSLFCAKCGTLRSEDLSSRSMELRTATPIEISTINTSLADRVAGNRAASACTLPSVLSANHPAPGSMENPNRSAAQSFPAVAHAAVTEKPQGSRYSPCMVQFEGPSSTSYPSSVMPQNVGPEVDSCVTGVTPASLVLTTEAVPLRSVSFTNGKEAFREPRLEVTLCKDATGPATTCVCGNVFMPDAEFCRKCGLKRDMAPRPDRFGFANVPAEDGRSLQITWIDPNGLLARWNAMHPDKLVKEGHFIISVNGSEDIEAMRVQLQLQKIHMTIQEAEVNQTDGSQVDGGMNFLDFQGNHGSCDGTKLVLPQDVALPQYSCGNPPYVPPTWPRMSLR